MVTPLAKTIELLFSSSTVFLVPRYQREYSWGKNEALEFLEDLKAYTETPDSNLFLGNMIFSKPNENESNILKIIDGQQRITTIILLLIACRKKALEINETAIASNIQGLITFTDRATARSAGNRLIPSESISEIFNHLSQFNWDGGFPTRINSRSVRRQVNKIKPIFDYFYDEISDYDQPGLSNFLASLFRAYVIQIEIEEETEAFNIFERTNARGLDLEASDLLKNFLFSQGVEGLEEVWSDIVENSEDALLRMLKHFYVSKKGYVKKSQLYRKLRDYGNSVGASRLVDQIFEFSSYYKVIRSGNSSELKAYLESIGATSISSDQDKYEKIYFSLQGLRLFKIQQVYPLLAAAINCFISTGCGSNIEKSKKLIKLFDVMEKYHFINNSICERVGNEVEQLYADFCNTFANSEDFAQTTQELITELKERLAVEEEFTSRFSEITYSSASIPLISYIFDRINNFELRPASRINIFNPDIRVQRRNHNIEHFFPQNPPQDQEPDQETADSIDNIGNLLVIAFATNSTLNNLTPQEKIDKLEGDLNRQIQNLPYVREFIEKYGDKASSWNAEEINNRAKIMAKDAYSKIWKID